MSSGVPFTMSLALTLCPNAKTKLSGGAARTCGLHSCCGNILKDMSAHDDTLDSEAIRRSLVTRTVGRRILYFPSLPSTMDVAKQEAISGAAEGTVVIADEQTAGRGRLNRSWLGPAGNVALSVILYPRLSELPSLIMLAALGVVHAIGKVTHLQAGIKWPNDVMIGNRKACGILVETDARPVNRDYASYAIVGIGINVGLNPEEFPDIQPTATSLASEAGGNVPRLALVKELLSQLDRLYLELQSGKSPFPEWRDRLITLGQPVRVTTVEGFYDGIAESVRSDGSLLVRCQDGSGRFVVAGDVTLRAK